MENYIGSIYSALAEAGIDTSNMTFEEVLDKYNEIAEDVITIEEATEEVMQEVEEAQDMEEVTPELMEEVTDKEKAYPEEAPTQEEQIQEIQESDKFIEVVTQNKEMVIEFLKEKGLL